MSRDEAFRDLETLYGDLERELAELRPLCRRSSRCCRFKEYGHQLWTTALELDWLLGEKPLPADPTEAVCPWLEDGACGARGRRMLGCRIYFCDPGYAEAMNPLYERYHRRMKDLHVRHGIPYEYRELTSALKARRERGPFEFVRVQTGSSDPAFGAGGRGAGMELASPEGMPLMMDIDPAAVERLRAVGGAALVEQIVRLFLENTPKRLASIRKGIEGEEWYTAERGAHSMKSTAGNLGIVTMQDLAGQLEQACECHRGPDAAALLAQIEAGWSSLRPRVEQLLRQPG